jgi:SAM-dependent methyltransferase
VPRSRWNGNIHYHPLVLQRVASIDGPILDVGCGEGHLVRQLVAGGHRPVFGIDVHAPSLALAAGQGPGHYLLADLLHAPFGPGQFGAVVSVAALHHMDFEAALAAVGQILRPGGVFAAIGLARSQWRDRPHDVLGLAAHLYHRRRRAVWSHPSPVCWPPPLTYRQVARAARRCLPGARYRRLAMYRYLLTWTRP